MHHNVPSEVEETTSQVICTPYILREQHSSTLGACNSPLGRKPFSCLTYALPLGATNKISLSPLNAGSRLAGPGRNVRDRSARLSTSSKITIGTSLLGGRASRVHEWADGVGARSTSPASVSTLVMAGTRCQSQESPDDSPLRLLRHSTTQPRTRRVPKIATVYPPLPQRHADVFGHASRTRHTVASQSSHFMAPFQQFGSACKQARDRPARVSLWVPTVN